jgi:hypothetical protein
MTADGQDAGTRVSAEVAELTPEGLERLVRFFRILDQWDRQGHSRDVSRVTDAPVACGGPARSERASCGIRRQEQER